MNDFSQKTFPEQIASSIEWRISSGKYRVGERIPTESQLAASFGVSRGTIREALKSLVSIGLLESHQGSGTFVKARERLQAAIYSTLSSTSTEDIEKTRILLEGDIAATAAKERDEDDLRQLRKILDGMKKSTESDEIDKGRKAFLLSLACSTHNRLLYSLYRYIASYSPGETDSAETSAAACLETLELLDILYDAIEQQDDRKAASIMSRLSEVQDSRLHSI